MKKLLAAAAAALTIVGLSIAPAEAATTKAQITVTGTGQVSVKRDQATTTLTVAVFDTTAKAAMAGATRNFNSVRAAIIAAGAAIIRQRRVIGTLFHDLVNPAQLVLLSAHDLAADGVGGCIML